MLLPTSQKATVNNYPYGWEKTTAFYSIEHKSGHGFRSVFQTVNPKTLKLNKPKYSTYEIVKLLNDNNGFITTYSLSFYSDEDKTRDLKFMYDNYNLFTIEEIKSIAINILALLKADIIAKCTYCNSPSDKMLPLYDPALKTLVQIAKTGENLFNLVVIDWKAVEELEEKGFNPFKTSITTIQ